MYNGIQAIDKNKEQVQPVTVKRARAILGNKYNHVLDDVIVDMICSLQRLANSMIRNEVPKNQSGIVLYMHERLYRKIYTRLFKSMHQSSSGWNITNQPERANSKLCAQ